MSYRVWQILTGILAFLCVTLLYAQRVTLNITILAMVKAADPNFTCGSNCSVDRTISEYESIWDKKSQGIVLGSFYWGYIVTQVPGGIISHFIGPNIAVVISFIGSTLMDLFVPTAANFGFYVLLAVRVVQGLFQGAIFPSICLIISNWARHNERSRLNAFVFSGCQVGAILGQSMAGLISAGKDPDNWRLVHYTSGSTCLLFALVWLALVANKPEDIRWWRRWRRGRSGKKSSDSSTQQIQGSEVCFFYPWGYVLEQGHRWCASSTLGAIFWFGGVFLPMVLLFIYTRNVPESITINMIDTDYCFPFDKSIIESNDQAKQHSNGEINELDSKVIDKATELEGAVEVAHSKPKPRVPWSRILRLPAFWSIMACHIASNWSWYIMAICVPSYMLHVHKFKLDQNGFLSSLPHMVMFLVGYLIAIVSDWIITRNLISTTWVRKLNNLIGLGGCGAALLAVGLLGSHRAVAVGMLSVALGFLGFTFSGFGANSLDLTPQFAGNIVSMTNMVATLPGIFGPTLVGFLTQQESPSSLTRQQEFDSVTNRVILWIYFSAGPRPWMIVFGLSCAIAWLAALINLRFTKAERQDWSSPASPASATT